MNQSQPNPPAPRRDPAAQPVVPAYAAKSQGPAGLLVPMIVLVAAAGVLAALYAINARDRGLPSTSSQRMGAVVEVVRRAPTTSGSAPCR